jgi:hypothetical protein
MKQVFAVASVLAFLAPAVHAQEGRRGGGPYVSLNVASETVKGAPYSAEVINESAQTLSDGNRIVRRTTSRVYRDSEGRTRREEDRPSGSPAITITDPTAGSSWSLDADNHIARQSPVLSRAFNLLTRGDELRRLEQVTALLNGVPTTFAVAPGGGRGFVQAGGEQNAEERLTPRTIEGLRVEGVRRTSTIAAGAIGNERAIVVTSDEWTSPELKALVLSEHSDPRTGTSTYKLVNVRRGDPAAALFQVPADYTVQTMGARGRGVPEGAGGRGGAPQR